MGLGTQRDPISGALTMNQFATGKPAYGAGGVSAATSGALSSDGYDERQRKMLQRRRAMQNRLRQNSTPGTLGANDAAASTELGGY